MLKKLINIFTKKNEKVNPLMDGVLIGIRKYDFEYVHKCGPLKIFWDNPDDLHQIQTAEMRSEDGVTFKIEVDLGTPIPAFRFL